MTLILELGTTFFPIFGGYLEASLLITQEVSAMTCPDCREDLE